MEQKLDEIATGETPWLPYLQGFYLGESGLENQVKVRQDQIDPAIAKAINLENLDAKVKIGKLICKIYSNYTKHLFIIKHQSNAFK